MWLMSRRAVRWSLAGALVLLAAGAGLAVLPEVVRRAAADGLARATGRAVAIEDVDLNLFTGRLAVRRLALARRDSGAPALALDRLEARLGYAGLLTQDARLRELSVAAPAFDVVRTGPTATDADDLLALLVPDPNRPPTGWTVTVERLAVTGGTVRIRDQAVAPERTWRVENLHVDGTSLSTRPGAAPGRLRVTARVNGAPVAVTADRVAPAAQAVTARVEARGFDLPSLAPYVPSAVAALPTSGRLSLALTATFEGGAAPRRVLAGDVTVEDLALARRDADTPFLRVPRLAITIGQADLVAREVTLAAVEAEGLDLEAVRDARGRIDLLRLVSPPAPPPGGAAAD